MTLEEVKQKYLLENNESVGAYWQTKALEYIAKAYAEQKCKEQRDICADKILGHSAEYAAISCAEPPKFD